MTVPWPMRRPFADAGKQVRAVAHRLHAAGHGDVDVAGLNALVGEHDGLETRAAHLVDGERGDVIGEPALERRLPGRRLAGAGRDDVAHDAFVDRGGIDACPPDCFADDHRAELRRGEVFQRAEKFAGRKTNGTDDDRFTHIYLSLYSGFSGRRRQAPAQAQAQAPAWARPSPIRQDLGVLRVTRLPAERRRILNSRPELPEAWGLGLGLGAKGEHGYVAEAHQRRGATGSGRRAS